MVESATERTAKRVMIWTMIIGLVLSGIMFAFKIAGFIWALSSPDFKGTFDISITIYFFVSFGWLCLLVWCFMTNKFKEMEQAKFEMLRQEEEYERLGV
jgi:hypothetical protein